MRIPITIIRNTLKTYNEFNNSRKVANSLQSDNIEWDINIPQRLQDLCLEVIANNWEANPILKEIPSIIDRCILLDILPTNLPLNLTVLTIQDDVYWKRCYLEKWPKSIPEKLSLDFHINEIVRVISSNGSVSSINSIKSRKSSSLKITPERKWKECFLEKYLAEYLEQLKPEDYDAEKIKELSDLCSFYVKTLELKELQCAESTASRIPLNAIVSSLKNLTELSLCFKQKYVGEDFNWNIVRTELRDIKLLGKGLEKCKLKVFCLKNSDINDEKAAILLKSLLKHDYLETLDFSHCKLSDEAGVALSKFCLQSPIKKLILANNKIGPKGVQALCYAMCQSPCNLESLDLRLNAVGTEGCSYIIKSLTMGARNLKTLYLNGCGIKHVSALGELIEHNATLKELDLSNNPLGEEMGKIILHSLRYNITLTKLDVRMCRLNSEDEFAIIQRLTQNGSLRKVPTKLKPIVVDSQAFEVPDELLTEIENALQATSEENVEEESDKLQENDVDKEADENGDDPKNV